MAVKASGDRVAADMAPPNYRGAVQLIRHGITKIKNRIQGLNKDIGEQWGKVDGMKVNKKAGQIFAALDKLEHEERVDVMRSLNGLIDAAEWDKTSTDLVDAAEDNVVHLRVGGEAGAESGEPEAAGEPGEDPEFANLAREISGEEAPPADDFEMSEEELAGQAGRTPAADPEPAPETGVAAAASRRRRQLSQEAGGEGGEPYTGDNSDLAGE
jgi:hypothetical protein